MVDPPDVRAVSPEDCRAHLWNHCKPETTYHSWAVLSGFFKWLYRAGIIDENPMARIEPPKRHTSEDLARDDALPREGRQDHWTTQIYLRRLNDERAMERVKDLSWGAPFGVEKGLLQ